MEMVINGNQKKKKISNYNWIKEIATPHLLF